MLTNDKNLSNWVIRSAEDWLLPVYEQMKQTLTAKSVLHVDETYAQIIKRSAIIYIHCRLKRNQLKAMNNTSISTN
ncbi:IS66 family transposase [Lysinibacillus sp. FJAT-14745]|uniref:IS66 family transposase n=1 Tax=Lysinibacillus sp. FJAT-14745 TaxID=1704289 RepID=UPI0021012094|nr:IS66 family transposase [Lysinibacillus sp. FJAT-14745]